MRRRYALVVFERMKEKFESWQADSSRLKQVNLELGRLASRHKACRVNSAVTSGLGAVILAISLLGLVHLLPAGADDWTQNPDSPVYAIATQHQSTATLKSILVALGFATGLGFLFAARFQCAQQRRVWQREGDLRDEMRRIRDRLYVADQVQSLHEPHPKRPVGQVAPLDPDQARGEYVGVYNPPASHRNPFPESA
jgi:hypothetical protein